MNTIHRDKLDGAASASGVPELHPFAMYGAWRAQVVLGTAQLGIAQKQVVAQAVRRIYEHFGRQSPWIVWAGGPFQMAALMKILPAIFGSPKWRKLSAWFSANEPDEKTWTDAWNLLYSDMIEPLETEIGRGIARDYRAEEIMTRLSERIRIEVTRKIRAEAGLRTEIEGQVVNRFIISPVVNWSFGRSMVGRLQSTRWELGLFQLEPPLMESYNLTSEQAAGLGTICRSSLPFFSDVTAQNTQEGVYYPAWDLPWLEVFAARQMAGAPPIDSADLLHEMALLAVHTTSMFVTEEFCFLAEKPFEILIDDRRRSHSLQGPCLKFRDGFIAYACEGVAVQKLVIENPSAITLDMISDQINVEARRVMTERYGLERFLSEGHATRIQQDDCGELFLQNIDTGRARWSREPIMWVRVKNSTPEPDGSYRTYILRVPPNVVTARQAVAWTFGLEENEYEPTAQT